MKYYASFDKPVHPLPGLRLEPGVEYPVTYFDHKCAALEVPGEPQPVKVAKDRPKYRCEEPWVDRYIDAEKITDPDLNSIPDLHPPPSPGFYAGDEFERWQRMARESLAGDPVARLRFRQTAEIKWPEMIRFLEWMDEELEFARFLASYTTRATRINAYREWTARQGEWETKLKEKGIK